MYCVKKITDSLLWTGADDRRIVCFEGVYPVPDGISYNSYLLNDEKTVLFDTADKAVTEQFIENVKHGLNGRTLDYIIVHHVEPDHTASLAAIKRIYPDAKIVCTAKAAEMLSRFYPEAVGDVMTVAENDTLETGSHKLRFITAPMVHWPEVMVTYDETDKILFSADAFGSFGALNGKLFADEVCFKRDFLPEGRRYYCNIVGKYGLQVGMLLKKAFALEIRMICPLHGYVWREKIDKLLEKYSQWSSYTPEDKSVMIAYASIYGNTEKAAEVVAEILRSKGADVKLYDVSVKTNDVIVAEAFRCSHLIFAAPTYNGGVFVRMEEALREIAAHGLKNRVCAFIQNGSWAAVSAKKMQEILSECKDMTFIENVLTLKSALSEEQYPEAEAFADAVFATME